ncbi:AgmX/PglI C-terminal domain-containing protein [Alkalimarinus coralli]|uniref:AgmX/PglI C-terminal domain-containing protein n=1 Tax=Alkalimarinus coralli TaxID=2935863 RepID=UPI00202B879B|nr:AgmX/PglI C-terminal domain-containing protein [Alkalimarinus coralli]
MSQYYADQLVLPWSRVAHESRRYWIIVFLLFALILPIAFVIPTIELPEKDRAQLEALPPQLAKVIIEKKKVVQKPKEEKVPPKKEDVEKKKEEVKKEVKPEPKPKIEKTPAKKDIEKAKEVAKSSGLLALQDDLADMRATLDTEALTSTPNMVAKTIAAKANAVDSSRALSGSGGVDTSDMAAPAETVSLAKRDDTVLEETEAEKLTAQAKKTSKSKERSSGNIRRVFDKNKSSLFTLYHRELRKDPSLEGKVVLKLIIEPNGSVSKCEIVSSDLESPSLERKIVSRVKLFNFGAMAVAAKTITYPIDFFQS